VRVRIQLEPLGRVQTLEFVSVCEPYPLLRETAHALAATISSLTTSLEALNSLNVTSNSSKKPSYHPWPESTWRDLVVAAALFGACHVHPDAVACVFSTLF
jgi:hypothetical protein